MDAVIQMLPQQVQDCVQALLRECRQNEYVVAVLLLGSRARGYFRSLSDTAICVILRDRTPNVVREDIGSLTCQGIDPAFLSELPFTIMFRVPKEGIASLIREPLAWNRIRVRTVRSFLDFSPLVTQYIARRRG